MSPLLRSLVQPPDFRRYFFWNSGIIFIAVLLIVGATLSWVAYDEYRQAQESEYRLLEAHARNADLQVVEALAKIGHLLNQIVQQVAEARPLNMRVLVIDDDETVCAGMFHLLRDWGCKCDAASSIEEALELASIQVPDLVISDYRLREQRTGLEASVRCVHCSETIYLPC